MFTDSYSSHFIIGCIQNWTGKTQSLGVYYVPIDARLSPLNELRITNVDPDGNVNLSSAGISMPLTLVQKFENGIHHESGSTTAKWNDCQSPLVRNGLSYDSKSNRTVDLSSFVTNREINICLENSCHTERFILFNSKDISRVVYMRFRSTLVLENGGVLVEEDFYKEFCSGKGSMDPAKPLTLKQYFCVAG